MSKARSTAPEAHVAGGGAGSRTAYGPPPAPYSLRLTPQQERIYRVLYDRAGEEVPLPVILSLFIGQYGARIKELRERLAPTGWKIDNRTQPVKGSRSRHSWFRLRRAAAPSKKNTPPFSDRLHPQKHGAGKGGPTLAAARPAGSQIPMEFAP